MSETATSPAAGAAVLASLWLLPFLLLMMTSFVKVSVVLGILRSALGTPELPSTLIITGVALVLTLHIMAPTARAVGREVTPSLTAGAGASPFTPKGATAFIDVATRGAKPVSAFMQRHSDESDLVMFRDLAKRLKAEADPEPTKKDFSVIMPAFLIGELSDAFRIGFLIFMPFLVIDLVIANILLALGMHSLTPSTIALPFKLLLFVMVDGWRVIAEGLILGYV